MKDFLALNMDAGERQAFASVGRCIYCGGSGVELTDEHIVPFSLVGNTILFKKAVCEPCRLVTHPYEERVLQHMYGNLRIQMDTPSRRRRKRPSTLDHTFLLLDDSGGIIGRRIVTRPWNHSPVACPSWESPAPGYLQGWEKSVEITGWGWAYLGPGTSQFVESVRDELGHQGPIAALSIYLIGLHRPARASKVRHELGAAVAREQLGAVCQPPQRRFCAI